MRTKKRRLLAPSAIALTTLAAVAILSGTAHAKAKRTVHDTFDAVWPVAVRYLRVDEGYPIIDKDAETGYVLFTVKDDGKDYRGALELVRGEDPDGRPTITLELRIDDRPEYMEAGLLTGLLQKLHDEQSERRRPSDGDSAAAAQTGSDKSA